MNEHILLLALYISTERLLFRKRNLRARKLEVDLARYIVDTYSAEELEKLPETHPELAETVAELLYDPDQVECELEAVKIPTQNELNELNAKATGQMGDFLCVTLPKALWRRELDLELDTLDQLLICEEIPNCSTHPLWKSIVDLMTLTVKTYWAQTCRECGKPKQISCTQCKQVYFCSSKCRRVDLQDKVYGHNYVECLLFQE